MDKITKFKLVGVTRSEMNLHDYEHSTRTVSGTSRLLHVSFKNKEEDEKEKWKSRSIFILLFWSWGQDIEVDDIKDTSPNTVESVNARLN